MAEFGKIATTRSGKRGPQVPELLIEIHGIVADEVVQRLDIAEPVVDVSASRLAQLDAPFC